ncbi:MAG TPA: MFS transporter [Candidatus Dormibacteraeota bacterium]
MDAARPLVPSERELESGEVPEYEFKPYVEAEVKTSLKDALKAAVNAVDFREITAHGPTLPVILMCYLAAIYQLDQVAVPLMLPEIRDGLGTSIGFLSALLGIISLFNSVALPFAGFLADRVRRTPLLAGGAVLAHASIALAGAATSLPLFVGSRVLGAGADLARQPVGFSLLTDYYPSRVRARVFAVLGIGTTIGMIAGPVLAGLLGANFGYQPTLIGLGGSAAVISLSLFLLKEPKRGALDRMEMGADAETASHEQRPLGWSEAWRAAWSIRTVRTICYAFPFVISSVIGIVLLTPTLYAEKFGLSPLARGVILSGATLPALAGVAASGPIMQRLLNDRPGRFMTLVGGSILFMAVALLGFIYVPWLPVAIVLNVLPLFLGAIVQPAVYSVMSVVVPARMRGLGIQVIGPFAAPGVIVPVILSIYEGTNGIEAAMTFLVPILAIGGLIIASGSGGVEQDIRAALAASMADEVAREARNQGRTKLLVCRDVDVTYEGAQVLFGVDFDVEEGELVALLGTNGAGKSTLLRAIAGIQQASNGAIFLDGDDVTHLPPHQIAARGVVMMPGGNAIFPRLTVEENLKTAAWMYRGEPERVRERTEEVLRLFPRLRERWDTQAGDLSGGEQQMVGLGQALLMRPRLLMVDELSLGLSPQVVEQLLDALREINSQGTTVIIVEQSINVALQIARRAVYMEKGEIRFDGPVADLVRRPDVVRSVFLAGAATSSSLATSERRMIDLGLQERETVLEVRDVALHYGGVRVLSGVSLEVARGEVVGVIGPNGAGKTSLFDVIAGFAQPDAGEIRLLNREVTGLAPDARARLGLARSYQNVRLFPALTVRENIAVALERHLQSRSAVLAAFWSPPTRRSERRVARRVDNLVESLGLGAYADKFLNELSTGTRRIVDIACLLAAGPSVLLLDEPSSGLAQAETEQLGPVIGRIVKETGCAVLIIEHDLGLVASASHRLVAMRLGEVMAEGKPGEVLGNQEVIDAILGGASGAVISRSVQLAGVGEADNQ